MIATRQSIAKPRGAKTPETSRVVNTIRTKTKPSATQMMLLGAVRFIPVGGKQVTGKQVDIYGVVKLVAAGSTPKSSTNRGSYCSFFGKKTMPYSPGGNAALVVTFVQAPSGRSITVTATSSSLRLEGSPVTLL
jgi:hypothetical protein